MKSAPRASQSIAPQRTRTIVKPGAFDNRDLKMRSAVTVEEITAKYKKFIDAWQGSSTIQQAANLLSLSYGATRSRAMELRMKGVQLKKFPKRIMPNYKDLNVYAQSILKENPNA